MVTTDHGGPNHAKFNLTQAYEELKQSRQLEPDLLQFYGMELNMPGMDHHTLIVPHARAEADVLYTLESRFDANELWPANPARNSEDARLSALKYMKSLPRLPLTFANHPSRSATALGRYGLSSPHEIRQSNDIAPEVYRGMEGAPGHQAGALAPDGSTKQDESGAPTGARGSYRNAGAHTLGGFDQMTAIVGGFWDSLLGEGRRFWIVATSDSHVHYTQSPRAGADFWPGEFQKTYVYARKTYDDVLDGLRQGRVFAVAGDLISRARPGSVGRTTPGVDGRHAVRLEGPASEVDHPLPRSGWTESSWRLAGGGAGRSDHGRGSRSPVRTDADRNETTRVDRAFRALDVEAGRRRLRHRNHAAGAV